MKREIEEKAEVSAGMEVDTDKIILPVGVITQKRKDQGLAQTAEVAQFFGVNNATIDRWCKKGWLKYYDLGRRFYVWSDIEEFLITRFRHK